MTNSFFRWESWDLESKVKALRNEIGDLTGKQDLGKNIPKISVSYFDDGKFRQLKGYLISYSEEEVKVLDNEGLYSDVGLRHVRDFMRIDSPELS